MTLASEAASPVTPLIPDREFMFVADVQRATGFSRASVWNWLRDGSLKSFNFKGRRVIFRADLDAFIKDAARVVSGSEAA